MCICNQFETNCGKSMIQYLSMLFGVYDRIISFVSCLGRKNPFTRSGLQGPGESASETGPGGGSGPGEGGVGG